MEYTGIALCVLTLLDKANANEEINLKSLSSNRVHSSSSEQNESYWPSGKEIVRDGIKDCVIAVAVAFLGCIFMCCIQPCIAYTIAYYADNNVDDNNVDDNSSALLGGTQEERGGDVYDSPLSVL